jgi:hypothetical protein
LVLDVQEDMVLLTPAEINRFISTLKVRYGGAPHTKKRAGKSPRS